MINEFRQAAIQNGLSFNGDIIPNGTLQRFHVEGDRSGTKNGWAILFDDDTPAGQFGCFKRGISETWASGNQNSLTEGQRVRQAAKIKQAQKIRKAEEQKVRVECQQWCADIWDKAKNSNGNHKYLKAKGVQSFGLKQLGENLMIPLRDTGGSIQGIQFIMPTSEKKFKTGTTKKGNYFSIGKPTNNTILICEGYATGASLHEATGDAVAIAFDAGNLLPVARVIRDKFPDIKIVICADDDHKTDGNPGITKARTAAEVIRGIIAKPVFDQKRPNKATDFNDLAKLKGLGAVKECIEAAINKKTSPEVKQQGPHPLHSVSIFDFLQMEFPERENIFYPWLPRQGLCMVHAYRGVGKTHFSLGIACAVATGSSFLRGRAEKPHGVLFIDGEMPGVVLKERIANTITGMDGEFENVNLRIITPDLEIEYGMPDLATPEGQLRVEPYITDDIDLIVLDNISTLCGNIQENKSDTWRPIQDWLLKLRSRGKSVLLVHHDGKGGGQRGTSKKEDILDTVIQLRHPSQYSPEQGAVFEVHFMKNRGLHGEDVEPFEASLTTQEGIAIWNTRKLEDSTIEKVKNLLADGYKQKDIAEELGITAGRVSQLVKRIGQEV